MNLLTKILPIALIMTGILGCTSENFESAPAGQEDGVVSFKLNVPGMKAPSTRALNAAKEKEITSINLVFFTKESNILTEHYRISSADISAASGDNDYQFKVSSIGQTENVTIAVIANAPDEVEDAKLAVGDGGIKQNFLYELQAATSAKWNTSADSYKTIPMYGEISISGSIYDAPSHTVELTRMLAKVDVVNSVAPSNPSNPINGNFELTKLHVVNRNTVGLIAPKWSLETGALETDPAKEANLPSGFNPGMLSWSNGNELTYELASGQTSIEDEIYLFESNAMSGNPSTPNGLRLVFEGNYTENGVTKQYFYPADFTAPDGEYTPVLRNHRYLFTITEASGKGYDGLGEAVAAFGVMSNLKTSLIVVDESGIRHMVFDGQHMIGVEDNTAEISKDYQDFSLDVVTNSPSGRSATVLTGGAWLSINSGAVTNTDGRSSLGLRAALNNTGSERTGTVKITAQRLELIVTVIQSTESKYFIRITDELGNEIDELMFGYYGATVNDDPTPQRFYLSWNMPGNVTISEMPSGTFTYSTASDKPATVGTISGGAAVFNMQSAKASAADLQDPFFTKSSTLVITSSDGMNTITKNFNLKQGEYNLIPQLGIFLMNGTPQTFYVKANFEWKVEFIRATRDGGTTDSNEIIQTFNTQYGGNNTTTGDPVTFTCFDHVSSLDPSKPLSGEVTVRFSRKQLEDWITWIPDYILNCHAAKLVGESNSYMINNSAPSPILIPVSQLKYAMVGIDGTGSGSGFLGSDWIVDYSKLKVQVLWTDLSDGANGKFGTNDAVVKSTAYNGASNVNDGRIIVVPGTGAGNAGVILYEDNNGDGTYNSGDMIRWSWHIWKSDYYPYNPDGSPNGKLTGDPSLSMSNGSWMDRNLGAMNFDQSGTDVKAVGFTYQWGRKDPFPGASSRTANTSARFYYSTGTNLFDQTDILPSTTSNLANATNNPFIRYLNSSSPFDWFTNTGNRNDDLWGGNADTQFLHQGTSGLRKSVYDPCPEGYRIPRYGNDGWGVDLTRWPGIYGNRKYNINYGGYYPSAGLREYNTTEIIFVGTKAAYWSATSSNNWGRYLGWDDDDVDPRLQNIRSSTLYVRCRVE